MDIQKELLNARKMIRDNLAKAAVGLAFVTGMTFAGKQLFSDNNIEKVPFNEQKDFAAAILKDNVVNKINISANTFQLDSVSAVKEIGNHISPKFVDKEDKEEIAATIYSNINAIENSAKDVKKEDNSLFNNVKTDVNTTVSGKEHNYDISVETPNGYSGRLGGNLRADRKKIVVAKNIQLTSSLNGICK